jgi:hypothetical protein
MLEKRNRIDTKKAFSTWKKEAYGAKLIFVLQSNISAPYNMELASNVIQKWRKYTSLRANREYLT